MENINVMTPLVFEHEECGKIRVLGDWERPEFVAVDCCRALEIVKTDSALRALDADEKGTHIVSTLGGPQKMSVVTEAGLYRLIFMSRKPKAKEFQRWIFHEVIPTIRKTGGYGEPILAAPYIYLPRFWKGEQVVLVADVAAFVNVEAMAAGISEKVKAQREIYSAVKYLLKEGKDYDILVGEELANFRALNFAIRINTRGIVIYNSGFRKLCSHYDVKVLKIFGAGNWVMSGANGVIDFYRKEIERLTSEVDELHAEKETLTAINSQLIEGAVARYKKALLN